MPPNPPFPRNLGRREKGRLSRGFCGVAHDERVEGVIRIFSARLATNKEREDYEENADR